MVAGSRVYDLGIGVGVDVPPVDAEHLALQLLGVRQVAVVPERNAERRVDVERLRFLDVARGTRRRVANVGDADVADQVAHVPCAEDLAHHAVALPHRERTALPRRDARCVLTAVLQQLQ
jgi:hypothetical protein